MKPLAGLAGLALLAAAGSAAAQMHDGRLYTKVMAHKLENAWHRGQPQQRWDVAGWFGGDFNRVWLETEGEAASGEVESADLELLYGHAISPFFDVRAGLRRDVEPDGRTWVAVGLSGLAPYWFELDATAYAGEGGATALALDVGYHLLFTQRLILEPELELDFRGEDDRARGTASGLTGAEYALRLRYELRREIAPYVGVVHERAYGGTADRARAAGEPVSETLVVVGVRAWFAR